MNATANNGDVWNGERNGDWWIYQDAQGHLYESKEVPYFRVDLRNPTHAVVEDNKTTVFFDGPIHKRFHDFTL